MDFNPGWLIVMLLVAFSFFFIGLMYAAYKYRHHQKLAGPALQKLLEIKDTERLLLVLQKDSERRMWSVDSLVVPDWAVQVLPTSNGKAQVKFYENEGYMK